MTADSTLIIGAAQILIFIIGAAATYGMLRAQVKVLSHEFIKLEQKFETLANAALGVRVGRLEQDIRDLQRGIGFIHGPTGIDREYDK